MSVQESCDVTFKEIAKFIPLDGTLLQNILLTTTAKTVPHSLKRMPIGFFVTKLNANAVIYSTSMNVNNISLTASATATVDIWVF
jgi:hypothetical protein